MKKFLAVFLQFLVIKSLDPDQESLEMLDPDPCQDSDSMHPDPQLCKLKINKFIWKKKIVLDLFLTT